MINCKCGFTGEPKLIPRTSGMHHADIRCPQCGKHHGFPPKPDSDPTKYKRPKSHQKLVDKHSRGLCEMCLTKSDQLPNGQALEAHHVVEYQNGGESARENIWIVCTACHRLIHWRRTYTVVERTAEELTSWMN